MKLNNVFIALIMVVTTTLNAQILEPVTWEFSQKKINETTYELHATAKIETGWHVYSQDTEEGGPLATEISFDESKTLKLKGKPKEVGELHEKYEEVFMVDTRFYDSKVDFVQTIEVNDKKAKAPHIVKGYVTFMACNDETCLPPTDVDFEVVLK